MHELPVLNAQDVETTVIRLANDIHADRGHDPIAFVGIHTRGVVLANRLVAALPTRTHPIPQGTLDISLYRDDLDNLAAIPSIKASHIPFEVEGASIILCDDVLFTGRTIRAAMNVLLDYGRPARIELAVLADRGHRELPIAPTWTGIHVPTRHEDYLRVHFHETDGRDDVIHYTHHTP